MEAGGSRECLGADVVGGLDAVGGGFQLVRGALGLKYNVTKGEQDLLNPKGINCIRSFSNRGIRVWGARTISSDPSWRYVNVRRLFNMVEVSVTWLQIALKSPLE